MYSAPREPVKFDPTYNPRSVSRVSRRWRPRLTLALALAAGLPSSAVAQVIPSEPIVFGGGRVTIGGDVTATFACTDSSISVSKGCADDTGFFNYSDYEHSTLRMLRVDVSTSVKATDRLSVLAEVRSEDAGRVRPYALYVRLRPWSERAFDI